MAVDDLWYLRKRDPATGERLPSQRHGRGKRWRVRWIDPETGQTRTELFGRRADAERHDANMHADISRGQYVDPREGGSPSPRTPSSGAGRYCTAGAPPNGWSASSAVTSCP